MNQPGTARAVLVGIDSYAAGWRLDGAVRDACLLASWLVGQGVPRERITLLASPVREVDGIRVRPADHATVRSVLVDELAATDSDFLFIHWGGHGVVDGAESRRLFCADATAVDKRNIDLSSLLVALRSSLYRHPHQAVLVDACQTFVEDLRLAHALTTEPFPRGQPRPGVVQRVLMAASPGEVAANERSTGLFSSVVREELTGWPPDLDVLRERVAGRFAALRARGRTAQSPSYLWSRGESGEDLVSVSVPERSRVSTAVVGELADLLLRIDEFAHESSRWQIVLQLLPREIVAAYSAHGSQKMQLISLVRTCERFPGGPAALLDAVRTTVASDSERARVETAFHRVWPI